MKKRLLTVTLITIGSFVFSGCAVRKYTSIKTVEAGPQTVRPLPLTADLNISEQKVRGDAIGELNAADVEDRLTREAVARALGQDPPKPEAPDVLVAMNVYKELSGKTMKVVVTGYPAWYHNFRTLENEMGDSAWLILTNVGGEVKHGGGSGGGSGLPFLSPGQLALGGTQTPKPSSSSRVWYLGVARNLVGSRTMGGEWISLQAGWLGGGGMEYGFEFGGGFGGESYSSSGKSETIGGGFNAGMKHDLPGGVKLVYGASVGLWYGWWYNESRSSREEQYQEQYYDYSYGGYRYRTAYRTVTTEKHEDAGDICFVGPYVKVRWKFVELSYRGLMGYHEGGVSSYSNYYYDDDYDDYDDGFAWASQFKLGLHFEL